MGSIVGARCFAPYIGHAQRAPTMLVIHSDVIGFAANYLDFVNLQPVRAIHESPLRSDAQIIVSLCINKIQFLAFSEKWISDN
jgi:hypothetical protein